MPSTIESALKKDFTGKAKIKKDFTMNKEYSNYSIFLADFLSKDNNETHGLLKGDKVELEFTVNIKGEDKVFYNIVEAAVLAAGDNNDSNDEPESDHSGDSDDRSEELI